MPTNTYVALDTRTLSVNTAVVEFTSISSAYTDLVLVGFAKNPTAGDNLVLNLNNATSGYSNTRMIGNGSTATSSRTLNFPVALIGNVGTEWGNFITQFMNYSNTTTSKTFITRCNFASSETQTSVNLYQSTSAISSIKISMSDQVFSAGSTFSLYGIAAEGVSPAAKATGGVITSDSQYFYHTFYSTSAFTPLQSLTCDYLVVAGGAGAGIRGGGGAGGLRSTVTATGGGGTIETPISVTAQAYTITVGAGGTGTTNVGGDAIPTNGTNSVFSTITSIGGGRGAMDSNSTYSSGNGGSGGGASATSGTAQAAGTGTTNQGYAGGTTSGGTGGGGGGGAGAVGSVGSANTGAAGGNGVTTSISGISITYAGGGGGGGNTTGGIGGTGGGGTGVANNATPNNGTVNTGGGGGGGQGTAAGIRSGSGGSGIVIIRYAK
jgi:hypothetical protein